MENNNFDQAQNADAFQNLVSDYTLYENESENLKEDTLKEQEVVKIVGNYKPSSIGEKKLQALFSYNEGDTVTLELATEVIQVQLQGEIIQGLPSKVVVASQHKIELLVKNTSGLDATNINLVAGTLSLETISIVEEEMSGTVIATYNLEDFNKAIKKKLDTNKQYRIKAIFQAPEDPGNYPLNVLLRYKESQSLKNNDEIPGLSFNKLLGGSTLVIGQAEAQVEVLGEVKPKTLRLKLNQEEKIEFKFTNQSPDFPATGIHIVLTEKMSNV